MKAKRLTMLIGLFMIFVVAVMLLSNYWIQSGIPKSVLNDWPAYDEAVLVQTGVAVESLFAQVTYLAQELLTDMTVNEYANYPNAKRLEQLQGPLNDIDRNALYFYLKAKESMQKQILNNINTYPFVASIFILDLDKEILLSGALQFDAGQGQYEKYTRMANTVKPNTMKYFDVYIEQQATGANRWLMPIVYNKPNTNLFLFINVDTGVLSKMAFGKSELKSEYVTYLIDDNGVVILSHNQLSIGNKINRTGNDELFAVSITNGRWIAESASPKVVTLQQPFHQNGWELILVHQHDLIRIALLEWQRKLAWIISASIILVGLMAMTIWTLQYNRHEHALAAWKNTELTDRNRELLILALNNPAAASHMLPVQSGPGIRLCVWSCTTNQSMQIISTILAQETWELIYSYKVVISQTAKDLIPIRCEAVNKALLAASQEDLLAVGFDAADDYGSIATAYANARFALANYVAKNLRGLAVFQSIKEDRHLINLVVAEKRAMLEDLLKNGHVDEALAIMDSIMNKIQDNIMNMSLYQVRHELIKVFVAVMNALPWYSFASQIGRFYLAAIHDILELPFSDCRMRLVDILEKMKTDPLYQPGMGEGYNDYAMLARACIERQFAEDLSLDSVAETLGISADYLGKLFKQKTGRNFVEFLNDVRIRKASELLRSGEVKVSDVSTAVGFNTPDYFIRVFKKQTGLTPGQFKKDLMKND